MNRDPYLLNENIHFALADFVMLPDRFKLILFPRGHWKTTIGVIDDSIRGACLNPVEHNGKIYYNGENWYIAHYSREKSEEALYEIRENLLNNDILREWYPHVALDKGRDVANARKIYLDHYSKLKDPTFQASSVEATSLSTHCNHLKIDDCLETEKSKESPEIRMRCDRFWKSLFPLTKGKNWDMDVTGTPWYYGGPYSILKERAEKGIEFGKNKLMFKVLFVPQIYRDENNNRKAIIPKIMDVEDYDMVCDDIAMGVELASSQYMLQPLPEGTMVFLPDWFRNKFVKEKEIPGTVFNGYILVDPATSKRRSKQVHYAAIIYCLVNEHNDIIVRDYIIKQRLGSPKIADEIFRLHQLYTPIYGAPRIYIEEEFGRDLSQWIREKSHRDDYPLFTRGFPKKPQSKESRIEARLPAFFRDGKVYFMEWMENDVLHEQLLHYGAGTHVDGPDALSRVCEVMHKPKASEVFDDKEYLRGISMSTELRRLINDNINAGLNNSHLDRLISRM